MPAASRAALSPTYADRTVLSTDNSIYQVFPQAIAFPKGIDDLVRIARLAAEPRFQALKLAPRGGGTGTNGQSLTDGLVVDLSRDMNRILEIDPVRRRVRVEAGVVKDQLNKALEPHGLFFAPELSTSNRATIGGMINTDACGQGSCIYGKTSNHVLSLTTVLLDGTVWTSRPLDDEELKAVEARSDRVGAIHRLVNAIHRENEALIAERFPKLNRSLTGYDLAHIRDREGRFDLNAILCGAEGTLGFIAEAELNVLPIPKHSALINIRYDSFDAALRDARALVAVQAASIETVDSRVLALARERHRLARGARVLPRRPGGPGRRGQPCRAPGRRGRRARGAARRASRPRWSAKAVRTGAAASRSRGTKRTAASGAPRLGAGSAISAPSVVERRAACASPRMATRPRRTELSSIRRSPSGPWSASGACARRRSASSATWRAAAAPSPSSRTRRCRPSTSPTTSPSSAPPSTAAAWSTACSAMSMRACSMSARPST